VIQLSKRSRALGIILAACGLFLFAVGYLDYRRIEKERAEMGAAYEMLVSTDLYTPRTSLLFKTAFLLVGFTGLATLGSAIIDARESRRKN
jgi:hypothetical protein